MSNMQADPGVPLRALEIDDLYTMLQLVLDKMEVGYSVTLTFAALYCIVMLILLREPIFIKPVHTKQELLYSYWSIIWR